MSPFNSTWRFFRGTNEASLPDTTLWRGTNFNDSAFADAPAPFWYGDTRPGGTQLSDMINNYTCFFIRRPFLVTNAAEIGAIKMDYYIDDGFVMWINGVEVYRENMTGGEVSRTSLAANQPIDPAPAVSANFYPVSGYLREGTNWLAIQVFNTSATSTDIGFDCSIESLMGETNPPVITSISPPPGSTLNVLTQIMVQFSEPVAGVSSDDLLIHGIGATGVSGSGSSYTFSFDPAPYGNVPISWVVGHGIADLAVPPNGFNEIGPGATWSYTLVDTVAPTMTLRFPAPGATVSSLGQIEITFSEAVVGVNAADLLINGQPATNLTAQVGSLYVFRFPPPAAGPVQVAWIGGHGIVDTAPVPNAFAGGSWNYTLDPNAVGTDLVITEISAANQSGLVDEDGEQEDWIEIYNRGSSAADLAGWSLSDAEDSPGQWIFPSRVLLPNTYLVVFASGKDRRNPAPGNRFHTSFLLEAEGEFVGLYTPDSPRKLASGFAPKFPVQRNDYSYGRDPNDNLRYFATPTPGASNGFSQVTGVVAPVHFSTARGHYTQPFTLALTCPTPGATLKFTTDGSEPTASNGQLYVGTMRVTNTLFVRAVALRSNMLPSQVISHSYFFNATVAEKALPSLSILTHSNNITGTNGIIGMFGGVGPPNDPWRAVNPGDYYNPVKQGIDWERPVSVEFIRPVDNSGFQIDAGLRVQGSDWTRPRYLASSKFSYRLYFRGDYGSGRLNYPWFPTAVVNNFDQVVLRAGHNDETNPYLTDELMRQLSADTGQAAPHGTFVNYWLNGAFKRYYNPCERVEEGFLQSWHGGGSSWDIITVGSAVQGGDNVAWNNLRSYVNSQNPQTPAVYTEIGRRMDLTNFCDYLLVNTYGATWDWPQNNWRAARERVPTGLFRFYVWDAEGAFAQNGGGGRSPVTYDTIASDFIAGSAEIPVLYKQLRNSSEFRLLWADRVHKHFFNNGALGDSNITARYLELKSQIAPAVSAAGLTFIDNILTTWIPQRRAGLFAQYNTYGLIASSNAPVFSRHGGFVPPGYSLSMTASNGGVIYYTTDGSDPRVMFTGAVSNSAVAYASPLTLNQSVIVKARTLLAGNWSAVTEASFQVAVLGVPLRITEIHYNPQDGQQFEFIELQNISSTTLELAGISISGAVGFTFPLGSRVDAGARLVLVSDDNPAAFLANYNNVTIAGVYTDKLGNGGDTITVRDRNGSIITSVTYSDGGGWPAGADGHGRSLEVIDPLGDPDDPANWRASTQLNGTPGTAPTPPAAPNIRLNEVLAANTTLNHSGTFPDFVELYNAGVATNLAGWSLSDDGNARKFVFPSTPFPAGGYLVVWCDDTTNSTPGLHAGFSIDPGGDSVFLYDPATNRIDAVTVGLQLSDYSVGRIGGSWVLTTPTTNAANVAAATASATNLTVNEWLANPTAGGGDWIELYNRATLPVDLRGVYLGTTGAVHRISSLSFIGPLGFAQFLADEGVGARHVDFRLPAVGDSIILSDVTGVEIERVSYTNALPGVSRGRLPDGSGTFANFGIPGSPGTNNYTVAYSGPILNEVLARNDGIVINAGRYPGFIELLNTNAASATLAGMSISIGSIQPGQWTFPPGSSVAGGGFVVIWCDGGRAASTAAGDYNTGRSIDDQSDGIYLFNAGGQLVNTVEFGFQVANKSIGLSSGQWRLLSSPTAGAANSAAAALGTNSFLRVNEWMAKPASGPDWFELFNATNLPVSLAGLVVTDDPSTFGLSQYRVAPLSFIGPFGFAKWIADSQPGDGRQHVNFSLDDNGDVIHVYSTNGTSFILIDSMTFAVQLLGVSQGRLPDGAATISSFPGSDTPGEANYALLPDVVINEVLTRVPDQSGLEETIELRNTGINSVNLGGWFLSDSQDNFKKYRIPDGTILAGGGYVLFNASQFASGPNAFHLNGVHGGEAWLSAADPSANLTGLRAGARFGPAAAGVSFGRYSTSMGIDHPALATRTLGAANAAPLIGPVVINEVMYHPPTSSNGNEDEYVELFNITGASVPLFDPAHPTNTWHIDGIDFRFPTNVTLAAGAYALVVNFDPANAAALDAFRFLYGVSPAVPVYGPFAGRLDNSGERVDLLRPDAPQVAPAADAGFVPYIRVDRVSYADAPPWPAGAVDGGGLSLQRKAPPAYGNEPLNWVASTPTPGAANTVTVAPPIVTASPQNLNTTEGTSPVLSVSATGSGPLSYQWRFNGTPIADATNASLSFEYAVIENSGLYDAVVSNPGGSAVSASGRMLVLVAPSVVLAPISQLVLPGANVSFVVVARATPPITYQWRLNGLTLPGETAPSISRTNVTLADDGVYDVVISSPAGVLIASATLGIKVAPAILITPVNQTVVEGGNISFSASISGNPAPYTFSWRRITPSLIITQFVAAPKTNFVTLSTAAAGFILTNGITLSNFACRLVVSNAASFPGQGVAASFTVTIIADSDLDGLPDAWTQQYFGHPNGQAGDLSRAGDDFDHDGMTNGAEYIAGTDPTNPQSFLGVGLLSAGPASAVVSFGAISNRTYTVQYSDTPGLSPWLSLADIVAKTTNRVEVIPDASWTLKRFYRVVTPRQP